MRPLLSIIVPTKNRTVLIEQLIKRIDGAVPECIEYVIHDNSDIYLKPHILQFDRIRFFHEPHKLSVSSNFSKALSNSRGQFVAFIGDDDEVNHKELVEVLSRPNVISYDTIISPVYDLIFHSGSGTRWTGEFTRKTRISPNVVGRVVLSCIHQFSRFTRRLVFFWLLSPDLWAVPKGYFGIFKRSLLNPVKSTDKVRDIYLSPDAYLIGRLVNSRCTLHESRQLFVPGTSSSSTSNLSNARQHIGKISSQQHLDKADIELLPKGLPDSFYPEFIWAASYLSARGKKVISPIHLAIIERFIKFKYKLSVGGLGYTHDRPSNIVVLVSGIILGSLFFLLNRAIVSLLILARYKLATYKSYDDH